MPGTLWGLHTGTPCPIPLPCTGREGLHTAALEMQPQRPPCLLEGWLLSTDRVTLIVPSDWTVLKSGPPGGTRPRAMDCTLCFSRSRFVCLCAGKATYYAGDTGAWGREEAAGRAAASPGPGPFLLLHSLQCPDPGRDGNLGSEGPNLDLQKWPPKHRCGRCRERRERQ